MFFFCTNSCCYQHKQHNDYQNSVQGGESKQFLISGDDFLPVFIFSIANATLNKPVMICDYLYELGDPVTMGGESGYYLCSFASALTFLSHIQDDGSCPDDLIVKQG